jgi:formylmethanofuran dehydrogenase subunit E-like metal-binding protein
MPVEKNVPLDAMTKVVEVLSPLSSDDRARVISAALALLGDVNQKAPPASDGYIEDDSELGAMSPRAKSWMNQNGISAGELQQVFHMVGGEAEVITAIPGRNKKEQTYNAYVLTGLGRLLSTGSPVFTDKAARALCEAAGCYDRANHAAHLKDKGSEFTGSKEKDLTLTAPGLKRAAEIVKELQHKS